jgi:hypothetical protein
MQGTFTPPLPPLQQWVENRKHELLCLELEIFREQDDLDKFISVWSELVDDFMPYVKRRNFLRKLVTLVENEQVSFKTRVRDIENVFNRRLAITVQMQRRDLPIDICRVLADGDDLWRAYVDGPNLEPYQVLDDGLPVVPVPIHKCNHPGCAETFNTNRQLRRHALSHPPIVDGN